MKHFIGIGIPDEPEMPHVPIVYQPAPAQTPPPTAPLSAPQRVRRVRILQYCQPALVVEATPSAARDLQELAGIKQISPEPAASEPDHCGSCRSIERCRTRSSRIRGVPVMSRTMQGVSQSMIEAARAKPRRHSYPVHRNVNIIILSERRIALLTHIIEFTRNHSYPPTLRELAPIVALKSHSNVHDMIRVLESAGYLTYGVDTRGHMLPRTLRVTAKGERAIAFNLQSPIPNP